MGTCRPSSRRAMFRQASAAPGRVRADGRERHVYHPTVWPALGPGGHQRSDGRAVDSRTGPRRPGLAADCQSLQPPDCLTWTFRDVRSRPFFSTGARVYSVHCIEAVQYLPVVHADPEAFQAQGREGLIDNRRDFCLIDDIQLSITFPSLSYSYVYSFFLSIFLINI